MEYLSWNEIIRQRFLETAVDYNNVVHSGRQFELLSIL